MRAAADASSGE
jgi:hypothetical protein